MNASKKINNQTKPLVEAKIIPLNAASLVQHEKTIQKTISEVYFDSLKQIDDLLNAMENKHF